MEKPIEIVKATECRCCQCGESANVFWPIIDNVRPDELTEYFKADPSEIIIEPRPHCMDCMATKKIRLLQAWHDKFDKYETERRILVGF